MANWWRGLAIAAAGIASILNGTSVVADPRIPDEVLRWSLPDSQIVSAVFGPDDRIAVVTKFLWPDGHLAESYTRVELDRLEMRAKAEPRFADPVVRVLSEDGRETCTFGFGWQPAISADGRYVVYENQKHPITGLRALAKALAGNDIRIHDCSTGSYKIVAEPASGHLSDPLFMADGEHIVFSYNDATNGSFASGVGVGIASRVTGQVRPLLRPRKQSEFWHLVDFVQAGSGLVVMEAEPRPKPGDRYLADQYDYRIWSLWPEQGPQLQCGVRNESVGLQGGGEKRVLVFDKHWQSFSVDAGRLVAGATIRRLPGTAAFSRDFSRAALFRPDDDPNRVEVVGTRTSRRLLTVKRKGLTPQTVAWSADQTRIVVVFVSSDENGRAPDQLSIFRVPK